MYPIYSSLSISLIGSPDFTCENKGAPVGSEEKVCIETVIDKLVLRYFTFLVEDFYEVPLLIETSIKNAIEPTNENYLKLITKCFNELQSYNNSSVNCIKNSALQKAIKCLDGDKVDYSLDLSPNQRILASDIDFSLERVGSVIYPTIAEAVMFDNFWLKLESQKLGKLGSGLQVKRQFSMIEIFFVYNISVSFRVPFFKFSISVNEVNIYSIAIDKLLNSRWINRISGNAHLNDQLEKINLSASENDTLIAFAKFMLHAANYGQEHSRDCDMSCGLSIVDLAELNFINKKIMTYIYSHKIPIEQQGLFYFYL